MDNHWLQREIFLLGEDKVEQLKESTVAVFGLGGVGGYAAEALCRAGVGNLILIDKDVFDITNLNRQIFSLRENIGEKKVEAAKKRLLSINPDLKIQTFDCFFDKDSISLIPWENLDYCVDAIDTMTSKIELVKACQKNKIPVISCMGTGFRMNPTKLRVADIYATSICPMAKAMRSLMRKEGIVSCQAVYSTEVPIKPLSVHRNIINIPTREFGEKGRELHGEYQSKQTGVIGSLSFVPASAGMIMAAVAVETLINR